MKFNISRHEILFVLLVYFILGLTHSPSLTGAELTAPFDVTWYVEKAHVTVRWKHQHKDEPSHGYYIAVQEVLKGLKLGKPDFVHVKGGVRAASIRGLKPHALYEMKVVAYSGNGHEASPPVIVKTKRLEFLQARNLTVSAVRSTSAEFHWQHNPKNNIHDIQFKLVCSGVQRFTREGEEVVERTELNHTIQSTSQRSQSYPSHKLEPNTQYSCHMTSVARKLNSGPSTWVEFTTTPGRPSPPPQPRVSVQVKEGKTENKSFTAELYPTDNHFGPISHYKVFAVPVQKGEGQPENVLYTPTVPLEQLPSHSISSHLVSKVSDPIPFIIGQYDADSLPKRLTFDGHWMRRAFKPETYYSIAVAAFTKTANTSEPFYSFSQLADPPVYIGTDMRQEWVRSHKPAAKKFTITVLSTLFSIIGIFSLAFGVVFVTGYYHSKKRDAYFFTIADSDSSSSSGEDEIYQKSKIPEKKEETSLLLKPPPATTPISNRTVAERTVETLAHNRAFGRTVCHSPETVRKMDEVPHTTADKHAQTTMAQKGGRNTSSPWKGRRSSSSPKVIQVEVEVEPSTTKTAQSNEEDPELETPMMTPAASFSDVYPPPQLQKSQDTSTAAQLPPSPPSSLSPSPGARPHPHHGPSPMDKLPPPKPHGDAAAQHVSNTGYTTASEEVGGGGERGEERREDVQ